MIQVTNVGTDPRTAGAVDIHKLILERMIFVMCRSELG